MDEILPGLFQWRIDWPGYYCLDSYMLRTEDGSILIDPCETKGAGAPEDTKAIIITVGWHERSASLFAKRTGAPVFVPARDVCMIEDLENYETYGDGDDLPCGLKAIGTPGLTRGEQVILSPVHGGTLFVGDAMGTTGKWAPGEITLGGHPNGHPQPAETLSHLLDFEFENLLPGHGDALLDGARSLVKQVLDSGVSTSTGPPAVTYFPLK